MSGTASPALARVARGDLCAGCGLCAALAPGAVRMGTDARGLLRPVQEAPVPAAAEAAIAATCPGLGLEQRAGGRPDDTLWGPVLAVRTGHATDARLRFEASSGGGLSALLVHLLESGRVDRVIQTAADPENPLGNVTVLSATAEEVRAAAGSRYAPSAPLAGLEGILDSELTYAFVGKPCDVAALAALRRRDARVAARIPMLVSFFCAGVPSGRGGEGILKTLGVERAQVTGFRYRGHGWPGRAVARLADGSDRSMTYAESWGGILSAHTQFRCKICPDGTGGFADVVCADAWETDAAGYPLFEEREGVSLILSRTEAGEALVAEAIAAGRLAGAALPAARILPMQPGQVTRKRVALARIAALAVLFRPVPRFRGFNLRAAARQAGVKALLKNFLGTARRLLRPRR